MATDGRELRQWQRILFLSVEVVGDCGDFTFYTHKKGRRVCMKKTWPREEPSDAQKVQREIFRLASRAWCDLPLAKRQQWELAALRSHIPMTGYNFFLYYTLSPDSDKDKDVAEVAAATETDIP